MIRTEQASCFMHTFLLSVLPGCMQNTCNRAVHLFFGQVIDHCYGRTNFRYAIDMFLRHVLVAPLAQPRFHLQAQLFVLPMDEVM